MTSSVSRKLKISGRVAFASLLFPFLSACSGSESESLEPTNLQNPESSISHEQPLDPERFLGKEFVVRDAGFVNSGRSQLNPDLQIAFSNWETWNSLSSSNERWLKKIGRIDYVRQGVRVKLLSYECPLYKCQLLNGSLKNKDLWIHERSLSCTEQCTTEPMSPAEALAH